MEHVCILPPYKILVVGDVASKEFHTACTIIQNEYQNFPKRFNKPLVKPLFEYKWLEYLCAERKRLGNPAWRVRQPVMIYANGWLIGDLFALVRSGRKMEYLFKTISDSEMLSAYEEYMFSFQRQFAYMDITIGERPIGRLIFMLYSDELPETCGHFADLCSGGKSEEEKARERKEREEERERREREEKSAGGEEDSREEEEEEVEKEEGAGEGEKGGRKKESKVWVDGKWMGREEAARRARCAHGRQGKNWEELREVLEQEVERICSEEADGEARGEDKGGDEAAAGARAWYRERMESFRRWKKESLLRVARELWRREGREEEEEEEVEQQEGEGGEAERKEAWKRPVMHVGGVVVDDEGESVVHVHGVVLPHAWDGEEEGRRETKIPLAPGHVVHVGGIVMHEDNAVVHVEGIVGGFQRGLGPLDGGLELDPRYAANVGGIVVHEDETLVHVQGIVDHGIWDSGEKRDAEEEERKEKGDEKGGEEKEDGLRKKEDEKKEEDEKKKLEGDRKEKNEEGEENTGGERKEESEIKEEGEEKTEEEIKKDDIKEEGEEKTEEEIKKENEMKDEGEERSEREKKEGEEVREEEEQSAEGERKTEDEIKGEEEENPEGERKEQAEINEEGERRPDEERKNGEEKEENPEGEIKEGEIKEEGEDKYAGEEKEKREEEIKEEGEDKQAEAEKQKEDDSKEEEEKEEEEHTKYSDELNRSIHIGGIVIHEGESVVHIQGTVEHGQWERPPPQSADGPLHVVHVGGIVLQEDESVVHVQGIVEHGQWGKSLPTPDDAVQIQGTLDRDQWEEPPRTAAGPTRAVHVGGIVVHEDEAVVHVQGIVEHGQWGAEKVAEEPWPEPGNVVHVGGIVMHEGRGVVHVGGIVVRDRPEVAPGYAMHVGGMVAVQGGDYAMLCHGFVNHGEWREPGDSWERMLERGYVEHVGGIVTVDGQSTRHIQGIVALRDDSLEAAEAAMQKRKPCYRGSTIHRLVKGGWIQGGELDSAETEVPGYFPDESFSVPFNRRGVLAMARDTHHINSTQFIITLEPTPWMRCEYVAFGQLVEGEKVLKAIEKVEAYLEAPELPIVISDCGVIIRKSSGERRARRSSAKEAEFPNVPTEIFVHNMLIAMLTDVTAEVASNDRQKFLTLIRNAVTIEALLEVMDAMAKALLADLKKESTRNRRRLAQMRSIYGMASGGMANFCGK